MELISLYSFDPTGRSPANRIDNETITVIPPEQIKDYSYVIPRAAPFYVDTLIVRNGLNVGSRRLIENVDYWCVIDFLSASHSLQRRVCVGIALLDASYSGTLYVTYQTVGGNYTLADYSILEELIRERYIVKHVSYEQIINLPSGFAPDWHKHEVADMVGMSEVVTSMKGIITALQTNAGSFGQLSSSFNDHIENLRAHTPSEIGLGNVKNFGVATLEDIDARSSTTYVTAKTFKEYISDPERGFVNFDPTAPFEPNSNTQLIVNKVNPTVYTKSQTIIVRYMNENLSGTWINVYNPHSGELKININIESPFIFNPNINMQLYNSLPVINDELPELSLTIMSHGVTARQSQAFNVCEYRLYGKNLTISDNMFLELQVQTLPETVIHLSSLNLHASINVKNNQEHLALMNYFEGVNPWILP